MIRFVVAALASSCAAVASAQTAPAWDTVSVDGKPRYYHSYAGAAAASVAEPPLILVFHAFSSNATHAMNKTPATVWKKLADEQGAYLAYLNGTGGGLNPPKSTTASWNDCEKVRANQRNVDDVAFALEVVEAMRRAHPQIPRERVYAYGYSNGGMMALRLGREAGGVFAAVASVAGVDPAPTNDECSDGARISPALIAHGTADRTVPFSNNCIPASLCRQGHHDTVLRWIERTGSNMPGDTIPFENINAADASMLSCSEHDGAGAVADVLDCTIDGGGHVEHSIAFYVGTVFELLFGRQNRDAESVEEAWKFMLLHRLSATPAP